MNFDELEKIIAKEAGVDVCPICGTPFKKYHSRQKTCATEECRKIYRAQYMKDRTARMRAEDLDGWRKKHADAQKKCRRKKKGLITADRNYQKMQEYWEAQSQRHIETDGLEYGKRQMERTLAQVPKIDVSGFVRKDGADDNIHNKDS